MCLAGNSRANTCRRRRPHKYQEKNSETNIYYLLRSSIVQMPLSSIVLLRMTRKNSILMAFYSWYLQGLSDSLHMWWKSGVMRLFEQRKIQTQNVHFVCTSFGLIKLENWVWIFSSSSSMHSFVFPSASPRSMPWESVVRPGKNTNVDY